MSSPAAPRPWSHVALVALAWALAVGFKLLGDDVFAAQAFAVGATLALHGVHTLERARRESLTPPMGGAMYQGATTLLEERPRRAERGDEVTRSDRPPGRTRRGRTALPIPPLDEDP